MNYSLFEEIEKYTPKGFNKHLFQSKNSNKTVQITFNTQKGWRSLLLGITVLGCMLFLLGRAINVQITARDDYLSLAEKNRIREFTITPERGVIYDTNNQPIARNKPSFNVDLNILDCIRPNDLSICERYISDLKKHIKFDERRVLKELTQRKTQIIIAAGLSRDEILTLEANIRSFPGISIETAPSREYLFNDAFSHMLGYTGLGDTLLPTIIGKTGIEEYYNKELSGVSGAKIVQVDSTGTHYKLITRKDALPGKDITLFADKDLQTKAYDLLKAKIDNKETGATGGAVVAQDPLTGGILAMVSYPAFDPNKLSGGISTEELTKLNENPNFPFFNRIIGAAYPPGSTFKMVTAAAVLAEKIADAALTIFDAGYISIGGSTFRNWKLEGHGEVNLTRALMVSNDTYFYTVGGGYGGIRGLGIKKLHEWAKKFGFGQKTGIDLYGEVAGFMPDGTHRDWYLGDDYISAIGQGDILATPLQTNNMVTYFANGGYLYRPLVVKSIDGVGDLPTKVIQKNLINQADYDLIRQGMHMSVSAGGTGYPVFDFDLTHKDSKGNGIALAGKTGTSEYIKPDGKPGTHAWFTVFGPYRPAAADQAAISHQDRPIVLTVFIEGGGGGADDAAPIAKELLDLWFKK